MSRFTRKLKESRKQESSGNSLAWLHWLLQRRRQVMADGARRGGREGGRGEMLSIRKWKAPGASVADK